MDPLSGREALVLAYVRAMPALRVEAEALRTAVASWLAEEGGVKVHSVTVRLKTPESLAGKLARPDRSYADLWDVTDLVGVRVITYFQDDVESVGRVIEERLHVALEHSIDKRRRDDASTFGYRSLHYVCHLDAFAAAAATNVAPSGIPERARCEIQVRTVLEHAWAEIEHDLGYKARDGVPRAAQRRLSRLAGLLELVDQEFVAVREDLASYAAQLPERLDGAADAVALDSLSLPALLDRAELRELDREIAHELGCDLEDGIFFPDYLLRMLGAASLRSAADVRRELASHAGAVVAMARPYFAFASGAWGIDPAKTQTLLRGYSLFLLAHVVVLRRAALRLHKVEHLAKLYRELDYPDDPRAAMRVASGIVDAVERVLPPISRTRLDDTPSASPV